MTFVSTKITYIEPTLSFSSSKEKAPKLVVTAEDLLSIVFGFEYHIHIIDVCNDFAPNMTRLSLNRLQKQMVGGKD